MTVREMESKGRGAKGGVDSELLDAVFKHTAKCETLPKCRQVPGAIRTESFSHALVTLTHSLSLSLTLTHGLSLTLSGSRTLSGSSH